ncbi:UbiD family decarboxylase [Candidatus Micrarchaeota archaeon]|nr:UbiD family decarboxylase [Candidatus Micrarchaeota archaeon]
MSMSFRDFIEKLDKEGKLLKAKKKVSLRLETASLLDSVEPKPLLAEVKESEYRIAGNVFATKDLVAEYLGCRREELVKKMLHAIENPSEPKLVEKSEAPVLENTIANVDLNRMPVPLHLEKDGGPYYTSAVVIANDKQHGRNLSFHRMMVIGKDRVVARILPRHLDEFITRAEANGGELDIAFVVGAPINVLLGGATSVEIGMDEMKIANTLMPVRTVKLDNGIEVPADAEFVYEGVVTKEEADEGPFLDLTGTYDIVRKQRVFKITKIHHRKDAIHHVLLPGEAEHKVLMGMPREPTIWREVNKVAECTGVNITHGGCSWLHAVLSIKKKNEDDGSKAITAAFTGHKSLKHVVIVDDDIDVNDMENVEWAIATRVQGDRDILMLKDQKGSSLDPSANPMTRATAKVGVDATMPLKEKEKFKKEEYGKVNWREYI